MKPPLIHCVFRLGKEEPIWVGVKGREWVLPGRFTVTDPSCCSMIPSVPWTLMWLPISSTTPFTVRPGKGLSYLLHTNCRYVHLQRVSVPVCTSKQKPSHGDIIWNDCCPAQFPKDNEQLCSLVFMPAVCSCIISSCKKAFVVEESNKYQIQ